MSVYCIFLTLYLSLWHFYISVSKTRAVHSVLSLVFFLSAFVVISSISVVELYANLCLFLFSTWLCVLINFIANFVGNFNSNHRVICTVSHRMVYIH